MNTQLAQEQRDQGMPVSQIARRHRVTASHIYRVTTANPARQLGRGMERFSAAHPKNGRAVLNGGTFAATLAELVTSHGVRMTHEGRQILLRLEMQVASEFAQSVARQVQENPPDSRAPFECHCWRDAWEIVANLKGGIPVQVEFSN